MRSNKKVDKKNDRKIDGKIDSRARKSRSSGHAKLSKHRAGGQEKESWLKGKLLKIYIIVYAICCVMVLITFNNWKSMIKPMMKNTNSVVIDSNGNVIETIGSERNSKNVELAKIPENLKNAYIDIEDERFYSHSGVDIKRTVGAIGTYVTHFGKSSFGGSTITQQLVKNLTGNDDNSIVRKMQEWVRAGQLELFCSKDEILESYLNVIYLAPNTYGVNAASKYYFDKNVEDLDLAECAFLAGINNSPNSYNPFSGKDNTEKIKKRAKTVLKKMNDLKHISNEDYEQAVSEVDQGLKFKNGESYKTSDGVYSYHTDALISELVSDISKNKQVDTKFATNYVYMAGLKIYSTENVDIQNKLEEEYAKKKNVITSSNTGNTSQSAMVIIDHKNGQVVACVGGLGKKTTSRGFNRATQALRQTGSASKPLAVLVPGINEKIFTSATIYNDAPTKFDDGSPDGYSPTDNDDYIGEITVRRAVESSQNIPFVKMMEQITPQKSIKYLKKMGITSIQPKDESLMLALGGLDKGITPLEMAGAYATIANDGEYIEPTFYTKVEDSNGKTTIKSKQQKRRVFSKEVAFILKDLLKQPVEGANGTAKACKIEGMDVAAKTGTTNDNYDKWLCGFTTYYTGVTWYGYDKNESIQYKGKSPAVVIWSSVMKDVHQNLEKTRFEKNDKVKQANICDKTGKTATSKCSDTHTDYFLSGTVPDQCTTCTSGSSSKSNQNNSQKSTQNTTKQNTQNETSNQTNSTTTTNTTTNTATENKTTNNNETNTNTNGTSGQNTASSENKTNKNNNTTNSGTTTQGANNGANNKTTKTNTTSNNGGSQNTAHNSTDEDDDEHDDGP